MTNHVEINRLIVERDEILKEIAALQARRADLSMNITALWQFDLEASESQPEPESLTGSEQPDSARTDITPGESL